MINNLINPTKNKKNDSGFSLVELLTVVSIIGILSLIAIPTFLNQRKKSQDAVVKSALSDSKKAMFSSASGDFTVFASSTEAASTTANEENNYNFVTTEITDPDNGSGKRNISIYLAGADNNEATSSNIPTTAKLSALSDSGRCISLTLDVNNTETWTTTDSGACGTVSSSADTSSDTAPDPSPAPDAPVITSNTADEENQSPTFNVAVDSGNTAKCRFGGTGSYTASNLSGSAPNFTYSPPGVPLPTSSYKISCYQIKPNGNYSSIAKLNFRINEPQLGCSSTPEMAITNAYNYFLANYSNYTLDAAGTTDLVNDLTAQGDTISTCTYSDWYAAPRPAEFMEIHFGYPSYIPFRVTNGSTSSSGCEWEIDTSDAAIPEINAIHSISNLGTGQAVSANGSWPARPSGC